jgi:acyl carrier protein
VSLAERRRDLVSIMVELGLFKDDAAAARDIPFADLGMDSLTVLDLCMQVEEKTGLSLEPGDLVEHPSLDALAAFLAERGGAAETR